mgnify:CR=1 FL=1
MTEKKYDLAKITSFFQIDGTFVSAILWGQGNINDTYLVTFNNEGYDQKYIVQRVNHNVFKNIPRLMDNVVKVTEHIRKEIISERGNPSRTVLNFIKTRKNEDYLFYEGNFFRAYYFIDNVLTYQVVTDPRNFYESAVAFGRFQKYLSTFPADKLYEVIPDFHNTRARYDNFIKALNEDIVGRANKVEAEIGFVKAREKYVDKFIDMIKAGTIPIKVTHNDTKINNVLLDEVSGEGICVIDLDTVMPGSVLYDFGDSIRSGCSSSSEDAFDIDKVNFRMDYFEHYAKGFLREVGKTLTKEEIDNLAFSGLLMTLECGIRFLTDYLSGDTYFKVKDSEHNLRRTKTHFKLVKDMEDNLPRMEEIISRLMNERI